MSKSAAKRIVIGALIVSCAAVLAERRSIANQPSAPSVSSVTAEVAPADVESFGRSLALDRIPAVVIVNERDIARVPVDVQQARAAVSRRLPLTDALAAFESRLQGYSAALNDGVVRIRPDRMGACDAGARRILPQVTLIGPVYNVLWQLAKLVDPEGTPTGPPSIVCGGQCADSGNKPHLAGVQLILDGRSTLGDALADLSRQAPGVVWMLLEREGTSAGAGVCRIGYYSLTSRLDTSYMAR
jgi:hypothetical protein